MSRERPAASVRVGGEAWQAQGQRPAPGGAEAAAILAGRAARLEDERGAWRGRLAADNPLVKDDDPAIEQLANFDGEPGVGTSPAQLHEPRSEPDGVVARDDAAIAAAEGARRDRAAAVARRREAARGVCRTAG